MYLNESTFYSLKGVTTISASLSDQVAKEVGRLIVTGSMAPGTLIEPESDLCERFNISLGVAKDTLRLLQRKGLIEYSRKLRPKVNSLDKWQIFDDDVLAWVVTSQPTSQFIQKLMEIRFVIEPKAANWAANRATEQDLIDLNTAFEEMNQTQGSLEQFVVANAHFYQCILKSAKNEFLYTLEGITYSAMLVGAKLLSQNDLINQEFMQQHAKLHQSIIEGKGTEAEKLMENILKTSVDLMASALSS